MVLDKKKSIHLPSDSISDINHEKKKGGYSVFSTFAG